MDTELTLKLDKDIIEQIMIYTQNKQQSLSALVETYFQTLLSREQSSSEISPIVRELSGIIRLEDNTDIHENYTDYLLRKYR